MPKGRGHKGRSESLALQGGVATLDWPPVLRGVAVRELAWLAARTLRRSGSFKHLPAPPPPPRPRHGLGLFGRGVGSARTAMELHILEHRVRVLSLARPGLWLYTHPLIKLLFLPRRSRCKFFSLTETPEDYTLMVDEEGFKELPTSEFLQVAEATWLVLNVSSHSGTAVQAAGVTKIARSVIAPLAEHHVSVLMLSTYQTDFILVREQDLSVVIHTLAQEFDIYREVGGEPVPVARDDSSNGFPRAQHGPSPTVHPIQSPQNRFCVLTLDPETLPAIATTLIDVLFYSHRFPSDLLLTSSSGELWRMVRIGGQPLGFDECGIVAQIAGPLAAADISAYYISTFNFDHALVSTTVWGQGSCRDTEAQEGAQEVVPVRPGS
uniref:Cytosolic arginine sensor for mTORC1 subunit 1 n=1 Tax=Sus scrofa TaxID=9823 RepID=A0A8D0Q8C7_PIG